MARSRPARKVNRYVDIGKLHSASVAGMDTGPAVNWAGFRVRCRLRLSPRSWAHSTENAGQLAVVSPLIFGEVLIGPDQPEDLSSRGLKVKMRILHVKHPDAEGDNFLPHFFYVVGLQLQIGRL